MKGQLDVLNKIFMQSLHEYRKIAIVLEYDGINFRFLARFYGNLRGKAHFISFPNILSPKKKKRHAFHGLMAF